MRSFWIRKARRAVLLEFRKRSKQEEQEYQNARTWLGGVTPAEDELQHRETDLRRRISEKKEARLAKWKEWTKRAWKDTPRKVFCWLRGWFLGWQVLCHFRKSRVI